MASTWEISVTFAKELMRLKSFPLVCAYLLMVFCARLWRRVSKPLNIRPLLVAYNFAASLLSFYCLVTFVHAFYRNPSLYGRKATTLTEHGVYIFWFCKMFELLDTVFVVLRHKAGQITLYHVYLHASIVLLADYWSHKMPWLVVSFPLVVNAFVHVVLYFYYGIVALSPENPPSWRKQVTQLQILQFVIALGFSVYGYQKHKFWVHPIVYISTLLFLLGNYYIRVYVLARHKVRKD